MDKKLVQYSLLKTIDHLSHTVEYRDFTFKYYSWNENIEHLANFRLNINGSAKLDALGSFISSLEDGSRVLVLTDGNFLKLKEVENVKKCAENNVCLLCFITVGADSNRILLQKIATRVFSAVDTLTALNEVCFGSARTESAPKTLGEIVW
jgi:hypothetical protein